MSLKKHFESKDSPTEQKENTSPALNENDLKIIDELIDEYKRKSQTVNFDNKAELHITPPIEIDQQKIINLSEEFLREKTDTKSLIKMVMDEVFEKLERRIAATLTFSKIYK